MTMLLAAHDEGLGALFFGVFNGEQQLRVDLRVPTHLQLIGAVALGYERLPEATEADDAAFSRGASASLPRLSTDDIVHYGGW
jgi:nitroreductase